VFLFGTLFSWAAAYFFKIYLARVLGAEALGIYALGMTVVGLAGVLAAGGLPQAASRFVAVYSATDQALKLGRFLWSSLAVLVISNLLAGFLIVLARPWIAGPLYHTPALASYLHLFIPIMLTGSLTTFLGLALAGFKDVARRTVITNFVGQILTMAFSVALLTAGFGLTGYLVAQIASAVVVLLLLGWATWKLSPPPARRPSLGLPILESEVVSFSVTFFGVQVLTFLLSQTDRVLLGVYINPREVGIYSIAATLVAFVPLALQSVNQIFSPTIAELRARGDLELLARLFRSLIKWTLGLTIPLAAVMILFARQIMGMFGPEFVPGWLVLVAGTFGQLVNCGVGSVGFLLLMSGQEKRVLKIQTVHGSSGCRPEPGINPPHGITRCCISRSHSERQYKSLVPGGSTQVPGDRAIGQKVFCFGFSDRRYDRDRSAASAFRPRGLASVGCDSRRFDDRLPRLRGRFVVRS
jgi:O-antigen/teichoic acid export membrane protein